MIAKPTQLTDQRITEALDAKLSLNEALNLIVEADIKNGQAVVILDGSAYGIDGCRGVSKGPSGNKSGYIDVELPNKMRVPIPANLLLPV